MRRDISSPITNPIQSNPIQSNPIQSNPSPPIRSRHQQPPNIPKANTAAKQHAPNPRRDADVLIPAESRHARSTRIARSSACLRRRAAIRAIRQRERGSRGWDECWVDGEQGAGADEADGGAEGEAGGGAVEKVPEDGVGEGEG
jgi:hypothetical protein